MAKALTLAEIRKMGTEDLAKEVALLRRTIAKGRYDLQSGRQKDSHNYKSSKKQLAKMLTVLTELSVQASNNSAPDTAQAA